MAHVNVRTGLGGHLDEPRELDLNVETLGELLASLEAMFSIRLVPRLESCFVVCGLEYKPIVLNPGDEIALVDVVDVHVARLGEEICTGQDRSFAFLPGDIIHVSGPRGC